MFAYESIYLLFNLNSLGNAEVTGDSTSRYIAPCPCDQRWPVRVQPVLETKDDALHVSIILLLGVQLGLLARSTGVIMSQ